MVRPALDSSREGRLLPLPRIRWAFSVLAGVTVASVFALVTLGGVVRVTGSGLGCPDWPLCYGQIVPPLEVPTLIEYSHRLMASVVSILVLATAVGAWRWYQEEPWILMGATLGLVLLGVQVILGGITVLLELPPVTVSAHLAVAEALLAAMVVVYVVALRGGAPRFLAEGGRFPRLVLGTTLAMYGLLLTGSYVTVSGATAACGTWWPLCRGELFPVGLAPLLHVTHRLVVLVVGVLVVTTLVFAWRRRRQRPDLGYTAIVVGGLFLLQVVVGAANVLFGFPLTTQLLHLTIATAVWVALVFLAIFAYTRPKFGAEGALFP